MSRNEQHILHIGYPKTGTTWFQSNYYPNVLGIRYIERPKVFASIIEPDIFSYVPADVQQKFDADNNRIVICEELLLGGIDIGYGNGSYIKEMALRLKGTFPNARVLILVRNQVDMIASWYYQYIRTGGTYSVNRFLYRRNMYNLFYKEYDLFSFKILEYDKIIDLYASIFGAENVDVKVYEDFASNRLGFMQQFAADYGFSFQGDIEKSVCITNNQRYRKGTMRLARVLNFFSVRNHVFKRYILNIPFLFVLSNRFLLAVNKYKFMGRRADNRFILGDGNIKYIRDYYKQSNQRLASMYKLDLERYGYSL